MKIEDMKMSVMKNIWLQKCRFKKIYGNENIGCENL